MSNQTVDKPKVMKMPSKTKAIRPLRLPILYGFLVAALLTIVVLLVIFPNLTGNPGFLALTVITTLLSFGSLGLTFSGIRARLPLAAKWGVSVALWSFVALDIIFLVLPNFISGPSVNEADPFAASAPPAAQATIAPVAKTTEVAMINTTAAATAKPTEVAMAKGTPAAMVKTTEAAMTKSPVSLTGDFNNAGAEPVAGKAVLGKTADGKAVLRFENLNSAPGPDLVVYLSKSVSPKTDGQVKDGIEIGKLKATRGDQNYELTASLDLSQYKSVVVYCKSFSVVFGFANLS